MRNPRSLSVPFGSQNLALCAAWSLGLVAAGVLVTGAASAQVANFPFPSGNTNALSTGVLTSHELRAQYADWKATFLENCGGNPQSIRVAYPENAGNDTRSEGIGYGMVIAAYMGDKPTFDGLWQYWQRFDNNSLMNWRTFGCGNGNENGSASDADVDAAMGLIVAEAQWGGYAADAGRVIAAIRGTEVLACNGRNLLDPGSDGAFGNCGCLNPSYFAPGYYGAFAQFDGPGAGTWMGMIGSAYATLADVQNDQSGLLPAWSSANQVGLGNCTFQVAGGGNPGEYQSDAARTPWRVATDLVWTGSQAARTFLTPMNNWLNTQNRITQIVDRYGLNGNALPQDPGNNAQLNNMTLSATGRRSTITMGAFATATVAANQERLDRFVGAWQSLYTAGDSLGANGVVQRHAFNSSLALLYGLLATGTMWNPLGTDPVAKQEPPLNPQPGNQLENGDFDEGLLGWTFVNIGPAGTGAEGIAMHRAGEMQIELQRAATGAANSWHVRLAQDVSVQAGQNYRLAFRGRGSAERPIKIAVEFGEDEASYTLYGALGNRRGTGPVLLGTEMQSYEWVFTSAGTRQGAHFDIDVGDSAATLVIDDLFFGETTLPPSVEGEGEGTPAVPTTPDPTNPGQTPAPGGGGTAPPGGPGQVIPNQGDIGSTPSGAPSGGSGAPVNGALPPAPTGTVTGSGACTSRAECNGFECSRELHLCYDPGTGYVWDASANMGRGGWSRPPRYFDLDGDGLLDDDCGEGNVWWPKQGGCYDPESGYAFDPNNRVWVAIGDNYTAGWDDGAADSTCAVGNRPGSQNSAWILSGLLGAIATFGVRRRSRAAR